MRKYSITPTLLIVTTLIGCSPIQNYCKENGFHFVSVSHSSLLGMSPSNNFSTPASPFGPARWDKAPKLDKTVKIPVSFIFAPEDVKSSAQKVGIRLGFSPSYSITGNEPKMYMTDVVAPSTLLSPGGQESIVYADLRTGPYTEKWGGTVSLGAVESTSSRSSASGVGEITVGSDEITTQGSDGKVIGYRTKVLQDHGLKQVSLIKGSPTQIAELDVALKLDSIYFRENQLVANLHVVPMCSNAGPNGPNWSDNPTSVQRVRLKGDPNQLATGGIAWNALSGLKDLAGTEVVLPAIVHQSANDITGLKVNDKELLLVRLDKLSPDGSSATVTLQRITVNTPTAH